MCIQCDLEFSGETAMMLRQIMFDEWRSLSVACLFIILWPLWIFFQWKLSPVIYTHFIFIFEIFYKSLFKTNWQPTLGSKVSILSYTHLIFCWSTGILFVSNNYSCTNLTKKQSQRQNLVVYIQVNVVPSGWLRKYAPILMYCHAEHFWNLPFPIVSGAVLQATGKAVSFWWHSALLRVSLLTRRTYSAISEAVFPPESWHLWGHLEILALGSRKFQNGLEQSTYCKVQSSDAKMKRMESSGI